MHEDARNKSCIYIDYNINSAKMKCFLMKSIDSTKNELNNKMKERRHLLVENKRFLTVQDVMEVLDVSLSYAYKLMRRLNAELELERFVKIKGRVSTQYFMERIYGLSTDKEVG